MPTVEGHMTGPKGGSWPPGYVNDRRTVAVASAAAPAKGVADTALRGLLRAKEAFEVPPYAQIFRP
jgi:hypothetical protein